MELTGELAAVLVAVVGALGAVGAAFAGKALAKKSPRDFKKESQFAQSVSIAHDDRLLIRGVREDSHDLRMAVKNLEHAVKSVNDTLSRIIEEKENVG